MKEDLQINDKVIDIPSGGGKTEKREEKVSIWKRVWNWIKKHIL